jgi:hypothetical protein
MKTWERILAQGPKASSLAKLVLLWITHANRELKINTLRRLVATSPETFAFEEKRMVPEALLLSVCCGLVSIDEKTKLARLIREFCRRLSLILIIDCSRFRLHNPRRDPTTHPGGVSGPPCHSCACLHGPPHRLWLPEQPSLSPQTS